MGKWVVKTEQDYKDAMDRIQKHFDDIGAAIESTTLQAVADIAHECQEISVDRAPVDTGDLRGSGFARVNGEVIASGSKVDESHLDPYVPQDGVIEAEVGFTPLIPEGSGIDYVMVQHEHLEFNHPKGGEAKFLEKTVLENKEKWINQLRAAAVSAIRSDDE